MKILIVLLFFFFSTSKVEAVELKCNFEEDSLNGYVCILGDGGLSTSKDDRIITEVTGNHKPGKSNDDVLHFYANQRMEYFPRGLTNFFKNIKVVSVEYAHLKEISAEDIQQFNNQLTSFWIDGCDVEEIPVDTFWTATNLESLHLHQNKIKSIETAALSRLTKLISIRLDQNPCTGNFDYARDDKEKIKGIINSLDRKCKAYVETTTKASLFDTIQISDADIEDFLSKLSAMQAQFNANKASTE